MAKISKQGKFIRLVAGGVILAAGYYFQTWWGLLGIIPIIGGIVGYCPLCKSDGQCGTNQAQKDSSRPAEDKPGGCCGHKH